MPRIADPAKQLEQTISRLQEKRQALMKEIANIDALFERCGIRLPERRGPGRPPGRRGPGRPPKAAVAAGQQPARRGRRRKRGKFEKSAHQSIMDFLVGRGDKGASTGEINKLWKAEGRAGNAYVTLGQLAKQRKVKKEKLKGKRGSRYTAA